MQYVCVNKDHFARVQQKFRLVAEHERIALNGEHDFDLRASARNVADKVFTGILVNRRKETPACRAA